MRRIWILCVLLTAVLIPGCRQSPRFLDHEFQPDGAFLYPERAYLRDYFDLRSNGEDYLFYTGEFASNFNFLVINDQSGKTLAQVNSQFKIYSFRVLTDPQTQERWLFTSINDQKHTTIWAYNYIWKSILGREEKKFDPIARVYPPDDNPQTEWHGQLYPEFIADIDGDGNVELVTRCIDGYKANPRGLAVFDFTSGKLKWRFDTSGTMASVLFEDFDGNGAKEFVCSTLAQKNTKEIRNGTDDFSGWLVVCDTAGQLLYQEMVFQGFGQTQLVAEDIDQDGLKEIFAVITTWGNSENPNSVQALNWTGQKLARGKTWNLSGSFARNNQETLFPALDSEGRHRFLLAALDRPLVVLDERLNEVEHPFQDPVQIVWDVGDLDLDGNNEILLQTTDNRFVILDNSFKKRAELATPLPPASRPYARIVGTGSGKAPRIAIFSDMEARYYSYARITPFARLFRLFQANSLLLSALLALLVIVATFIFRHRERILIRLIDRLQLGVIVMTNKNRIRNINNYVTHLLQDEHGKLPARKLRYLSAILPPLKPLLANFSRSKASEFTTELSLGAGKTKHKVSFHRLHGFFRRYLIVLAPEHVDITSLNDKLAWAETAKRLAHNVRRNLQNALLAMQPVLENGLVESDKANLEIVRGAIENVSVFTHAFQRFAELEDMELKVQDVIPSVEHCLARLTLPDNVKLIRDWSLKSVETRIEPIRFEEALQNVLHNALDAMPSGGILQVSVRHFPRHSGPKGELSVLIEVEDSGKGIPAKYLDEIWQLYFTTKEAGNGIGLPETRKIIESMGGAIVIESEEGKGTVVSIWLQGGLSG